MKKPRGVHYVSDSTFGWTRKIKDGKAIYLTKRGNPLKEKDEERVKNLVIPPAWTEVTISPDPRSHIQAVGVDARGRKQYIYHPDWVEYNQKNKFDSLQRFGEILPNLRETVNGHMRQHTLTRERILATMVWLLEHTFIRVGNKEYAKENQSYGLTTLRSKHLDVDGNTIKFSFKGKSNIYHELSINHPRVVATIKKCIELPGYEIFQYLDDDGDRHKIDSADVNNYLKDITGESLSAKDFRTWGGTTLAGDSLYRMGAPTAEVPAEKALVHAVKEVSSHLGNTVAVCRKYYIHPSVIKSYEQNQLVPHFNKVAKAVASVPDGLTWEEYATWSLLSK
jgi:DNA topoisomerase-1